MTDADRSQGLTIRPLPLTAGAAAIEGASRTALHLLWGVPGALLCGIVLGGLGAVWATVGAEDLELLGRAVLGPVLALPLPLALTAGALNVASLGARRMLVGRYADEFRPLAIERHELARSPVGRARSLALIAALILGGLAVLFVFVPLGIREWWALIPALVTGALAALLFLTVRATAGARERAGARWDGWRERWPRTGTRPRADGRAEDDRPLTASGPVVNLALLSALAGIGVAIWGGWWMSQGNTEPPGPLPVTPLLISAVLLVLAVLGAGIEVLAAFTKRLLQYRYVERDPVAAAESRVDAGDAPTAWTAAAREILRHHPLRIPAILCAALGGTLLVIAPSQLFIGMTGQEYSGAALGLLWSCALPGAALTGLAWALFSRAAWALPRHRLRVLEAYPGIDPVLARVKKRDSETGGYSHVVVYGNRAGDPELLEKYSDDSPR